MFVISDHGFEWKSRVFNINVWLKRRGLLKYAMAEDSAIKVASHFIHRTKKPFSEVPVPRNLPSFLLRVPKARGLLNLLLAKIFKERAPEYKVTFNPKHTLAFVPTNECFGIYINSTKNFDEGIRMSEEEHGRLLDQLTEELMNLRFPHTDEKVFEHVWRRQELYSGEFTSLAPDIVFSPKKSVLISSAMGEYLNEFQVGSKAFHNMEAILIAYGSSVKRGQHIEQARLWDLTPTILHILGMEISLDMDGRVLREIFCEDSEFCTRKPKYHHESEKERIKTRLKRLSREGRI